MVTKRDELARGFSERFSPDYWDHSPEDKRWRDGCYARVDWFLDALMEPGEDAAEAGHEVANKLPGGHVLAPGYGVDVYEVHRAILSHIKEGR